MNVFGVENRIFACRRFVIWTICLAIGTIWPVVCSGAVLPAPESGPPWNSKPVLLLSMFPDPVTNSVKTGLQKSLGKKTVTWVRPVKNPVAAEKFFRRLVKKAEELPFAVVCLGTKLYEEAVAILPQSILIVSILSRDPSASAPENAGGVYITYAPERTLDALKKMLPSVRNVGVMVSSDARSRFTEEFLRQIDIMFGFNIILKEVSSSADIASGIAGLLKDVDAVWLVQDRLVLKSDNVRYILGKSIRARKPVVGLSASYVKAGALFCLKQDFGFIGQELGEIVEAAFKEDHKPDFNESEQAVIVINKRILRLLKVRLPREYRKDEIEFIE